MSSELSRRRGFGEFIIVWIIEEEADVILNRIRNSIKIFHNANACINYIQNAKNENIFLVMSYLLIEEIIAQVHDLPQLNSIYIVDPTSSSTEGRYCKVKGIFSNISSLDEHLTESIRTAEENTIPISILSSNVTCTRLVIIDRKMKYFFLCIQSSEFWILNICIIEFEILN
jgi:hypothetical protein